MVDIHGINSRDERAWKGLFSMYYAPLCVFVEGMMHCGENAEDIVQEALTKVWESDSRFDNDLALRFFLYKTARNHAISWMRKNGGHDMVDLSLMSDSMDEEGYAAAVREELYRMLHEAIENLPDQQKRVMKMSLQGKTGKEIAELLNLSINTVKVHKMKAMENLRKNAGEKALFLLFIADFLLLD